MIFFQCLLFFDSQVSYLLLILYVVYLFQIKRRRLVNGNGNTPYLPSNGSLTSPYSAYTVANGLLVSNSSMPGVNNTSPLQQHQQQIPDYMSMNSAAGSVSAGAASYLGSPVSRQAGLVNNNNNGNGNNRRQMMVMMDNNAAAAAAAAAAAGVGMGVMPNNGGVMNGNMMSVNRSATPNSVNMRGGMYYYNQR